MAWSVLLVLLGSLLFLRNLKRLFATARLPKDTSLLLIAHPDDESMFFAPTLLSLGKNAIVLCLSHGNYYGRGETRKGEMRRLCKYLGAKLLLFDFADNEDWDPKLVCKIIGLAQNVYGFGRIYTFDENGVSGHKNHISCFGGARLFSEETGVPSFYLKSKGLVAKYFIDVEVSRRMVCTSVRNMYIPAVMMAKHRSQMVWYRLIYMFLSNYMSYNDYGCTEEDEDLGVCAPPQASGSKIPRPGFEPGPLA